MFQVTHAHHMGESINCDGIYDDFILLQTQGGIETISKRRESNL